MITPPGRNAGNKVTRVLLSASAPPGLPHGPCLLGDPGSQVGNLVHLTPPGDMGPVAGLHE